MKKNKMFKIRNFLRSLFWHMCAGFPKSSTKLIFERYDICSSCEYISKNKDQCLECGCNISRKKVFMNKLAWKDQKCPIAKW